jgi:imidazolonepropionase-like amidohydrolase
MQTFRRVVWGAVILAVTPALQGCLATKVVTVPVKAAYGAGKLVVKGTAAAVRAVVPDDDENTPARDEDPQDPSQEQPPAR